MKGCDSDCVHNLTKLDSVTSSASPIHQLFGNDSPVWNQSCEGSDQQQQSRRRSLRSLPFLCDLMAIASRLAPFLASDQRAGTAKHSATELAEFWASELPNITARFCCEHEYFRSGSGSRCLQVVEARAACLVDGIRGLDEQTQAISVLCGDEACHLLLHLLDIALTNNLIDHESVMTSICNTAAVLAYSFSEPVSDGLWQAVVSLGGMILSRYDPTSNCVATAAELAYIAVEQLHGVSSATQKCIIGLVYVLRNRFGCDMDGIVESAVRKCESGDARLKCDMGRVILDIYGAADSLPDALAASVRSLASDWDPQTRSLWMQVVTKVTIRTPLVSINPFAELQQSLGDRSGLPHIGCQAVSRCTGALSISDAMLVAKLVLNSARNAGFGLSDAAVGTIGSLYRATGAGDLASTRVHCACAVVIAGAARRICADEGPNSALQRRMLLSQLVDAVRAHPQVPATSSDGASADDTANGLYWALELLFQLCVSDDGVTAGLLLGSADVLQLLLGAAAACSNITFAVYVCQSAPINVASSNTSAVIDRLRKAVTWSNVSHMFGDNAGDAVFEMAQRCANSADRACSELAAMSLADTSSKDASSRLGRFDEKLFASTAATLDNLRFDRLLFSDASVGGQHPSLLRHPGRRICSVIPADLFLQRCTLYNEREIVTNTPLSIRGPPCLDIERDSLPWTGLSVPQKISGIELCLAHGLVQPAPALSALQDIDIDRLSKHDAQQWFTLYTAATIATSYDTGVADALQIERRMSQYDLTTGTCDLNICFALLSDFAIDTTSISDRLRTHDPTQSSKAKEVLLYYNASRDGSVDCTNELYTQVLNESTGAIRFTASGTFDVASRLIAHMSTKPLDAPMLLTDHLSSAAVEQLAAYIPQLLAMLCFQSHKVQNDAVCLASDSALAVLELLAQSAPDIVVFYAVVASNSLPESSSSSARVARLLRLFGAEQIASIRKFLACVSSIAVLPQEQLRWVCTKAKGAHARAVVAYQKSKPPDGSFIVETLQQAYKILDEYANLDRLSTPAEQEFISTLPQLRRLLDRLQRADDFDTADHRQLQQQLDGVWTEVFKVLSTPASLPVAYASPQFAEISGATPIPIPVLTHPAEPMYFDGAGDMLHIIGSKTRPKLLRLYFHTAEGAGVNEKYIFKGSEDLRIDESVMQTFIRLNWVLGSSQLRADSGALPMRSELAVYNVVPTAAYGGIIRVVDDAPSLFTLYSQHQHQAQRVVESTTTGNSRRARGSNNVAVSAQAKHGLPVGLQQISADHAKRALASAGLSPTLSPGKWPQAVADKVYDSLCSTTPPNLLHTRLMRAASSSAHLLISVQRLVRSIGMASAAGYVVGLGDRHLDNLLIRLDSAQLVHIDFNVCYDFGGVSQIPEQVPFRMTPMLAYLCGSPHRGCAEAPFAMSRVFANAFAATLQFARMDRDVLVNGIASRSLFRPFMEWSWIEEKRLCEPQQRSGSPPAHLPLPQSLHIDLKVQTDPTSISVSEFIKRTGLCPPQAFWPHDNMASEQSVTEMQFGWRLARGAVDRMDARLHFGVPPGASQTEHVRQQTLALWEAATYKPRLSRMFAGWAPWV